MGVQCMKQEEATYRERGTMESREHGNVRITAEMELFQRWVEKRMLMKSTGLPVKIPWYGQTSLPCRQE